MASKLSNVEEEAIAAYRSGCSYEEIAGRFGCSRMTLWRLLKRLGEPCRPDRWDRIAALATEIVAFYKAGHSIAETTERFGCDFRSVHRILRGHEIPKNPLSSRKHSLSQEVARRYRDGESAELLAKVYGVSASTIVRWIRAVKGEIRTTSQSWEFRPPFPRLYRLKEDVFETITEESAYWIGFLMADGNVRDVKPYGQSVYLGLCGRDEAHVRKFAAFLNTDCPVKIRDVLPSGLCAQNKNNKGIYRTVSIDVHSARIVKSLKSYGVIPRKSLVARVIGLGEDRDFWRGVFDGDGHLSYRANKVKGIKINFHLIGSEYLIEQFRQYVRGIVHDIPPLAARPVKGIKAWRFTLSGRKAALVIDALYRDCKVALDRKHRIATEIIAAVGLYGH